VATKEGGAITGEERIREHLDLLYGALVGWEGRPARYQLERLEVLRRELDEVAKKFADTAATEIRPLDEQLRQRRLEPVDAAEQLTERGGERGGELAEAVLRCLRSAGSECTLPARAARGVDLR